MTFIARRIAVSPAGQAWPVKIVYRRHEVDALRDVAAYAVAARRAADTLLNRAREEAQVRDTDSAHARAERERRADAALLKRAVALEARYRACRAALVSRLEEVLDATLSAALDRIALTVPPDERVRIVAAMLREQIEAPPSACLLIAPQDAAVCEKAGMALPWTWHADETVAPGSCRLVLDDGAWTLAFGSVMHALGAVGEGNVVAGSVDEVDDGASLNALARYLGDRDDEGR